MIDTTRLLWLDLCCGLGGASRAARARGWRTLGVDNNAGLQPDIVADIRHLPLARDTTLCGQVTVLWASPPCVEYSKAAQLGLFPEWRDRTPNRSIWLAVYGAIDLLQPTYWVIENVKGAQKWWGPASTHFGSVYLWTNLDVNGFSIPTYKSRQSSRNPQIRAMTPLIVSETICNAVETALAQGTESVTCSV